jgi:hypothetical protein
MRRISIVILAAATLSGGARAAEWEESNPYYEDDAWYDISEWLDGNDYNPTDEVVGRWDDETYHASADDGDADNDAGYGYDDRSADDDWYYDYYENRTYSTYGEPNESGIYAFSSKYYDYDGDGYYDAMSSLTDSDADGWYDDYDYYSFSDRTGDATASDQTTQQQPDSRDPQSKASSKRTEASGTIEQLKKVKVRGGGQHHVARLKTDDGKTTIVDLGRADQLSVQPEQGQRATVYGPTIKVGDHSVVLAKTLKLEEGQEQRIDRAGRKFSGKIKKLKTAQVHGEDHQLAIVELDSGKQALVDLGQRDKLQAQLGEGDQVEVHGVPVKVKDRLVLMANSVTKDGEKTSIQRIAARQPAG